MPKQCHATPPRTTNNQPNKTKHKQTFCLWQHAVPLLESHAVIFPDETRCFDALAEMYRLVRGISQEAGGEGGGTLGGADGTRCFDALAEMYRLVSGTGWGLVRKLKGRRRLVIEGVGERQWGGDRGRSPRDAMVRGGGSQNAHTKRPAHIDTAKHTPSTRSPSNSKHHQNPTAPRGRRARRRVAQALRGAAHARRAVAGAARPLGGGAVGARRPHGGGGGRRAAGAPALCVLAARACLLLALACG